MITLKDISVSFTDSPILHDINLTVARGDFVALVGANGAGKSTLIRVIRGLLPPGSGEVFIDGVSIARCKSSALAKKIGFLFQNPDRHLCTNSIRDEMMFTLKHTISDPALQKMLCDNMISKLSFNASDDPFQLSRGKRQMIALASVLVSKPEILLLDEPTTGLDDCETMQMMRLVQTLNKAGTTVIMVCHDMELVLSFAKRMILLKDGTIFADGETRELFSRTDILEYSALCLPQIVALSHMLGESFANILTVEDMIGHLLIKKGACI